MKQITALLILLAVLVSGFFLTAKAQTHLLPADLIVLVEDENGYHNTLLKTDAHTLKMLPFYRNQDANSIAIISWSPNGMLLAIVQYFGAEGFQLCMLDRTGILQKCMAESPFWAGNDNRESQLDALTWSADSSKVQYVATSEENIRLIEADVTTGEPVRVIFELPKAKRIILVWDVTQQYVVAGNHFSYPTYNLGLDLFSLDSNAVFNNQRTDLFSTFSRIEIDRMCSRASPKGTFFTLLANPHPQYLISDSIWLLNAQGQVMHQINPASAGDLALSCPVWQSDEQALYFTAFNIQSEIYAIYRYTISDKQLHIWFVGHEQSLTGGLITPLEVYGNGQALAGVVARFAGYAPRRIGVIFENGHEIIIKGNYKEFIHPLWVPPLDE